MARQGLRYALAGIVVGLIYLATTTVLSAVVGLPFQLALAIGFGVAIVFHFTLQRWFVWSDHTGYALPIGHQLSRYLATSGTQYGLTAVSTSLLPGVLGLPTEVVYLVTALSATSINFLIFRHGIFHATVAPDRVTGPKAPEVI